MAAIAKNAGFVISAEELKRAQAEVTDKELESVARGDYALDGILKLFHQLNLDFGANSET